MNVFEVARIVAQKKHENRYNIFIKKDGKEHYGFSVEEETIINEGIRKGQILDQTTIDALMKKDTLHKAYNRALGYLGHRMRSVKELRTYLIEKEVETEQIEIIINRLKEQKILDDQAFATAYVRTKIKTTFKGPAQLKRELIQKGIESAQIDQALLEYSETEQIKLIQKWLEKQLKKTKRDSYRLGQMKMKRQLIQKGFNQSVIDQALQMMELEKDEEKEWQALVFQGEKALRRYRKKTEGYLLEQKVKASLYQKGFNQDQIGRFIEQYLE